MATFTCRVQFLDDTDPFNSTNFPEPTRPPLYTFREDIPLINQIAGVHRLLKAPHKVFAQDLLLVLLFFNKIHLNTLT
uniref:FHOD1 N-terminal GTPase-binding domain-containing protein n=1 Tax=Cyprinodon variegatus TaxID=28743 RepID=A0A3Q2E4E0_CYPVA